MTLGLDACPLEGQNACRISNASAELTGDSWQGQDESLVYAPGWPATISEGLFTFLDGEVLALTFIGPLYGKYILALNSVYDRYMSPKN